MKSSLSNIDKQVVYDYKQAQYMCKLIRKKIFGKTNRFLYLFSQIMIINNEPNKKKPDRIFQLDQIKRIEWRYQEIKNPTTKKVEQKYLKGFILDYEDQQLLYYSDLDSLKLLKFHLAKHLFQSKVQDEYEARTVIGEGNYAMVLELKHLHSDLIYAAKCIEKKKLQKVDNGMKSVLNEIRIMRTLSPHSLIVNLHEVYEGDNNIYIVLDLMKGGSLYSEMRQRNRLFTRQEIQTIMKNILSGLAYMHSKGIMHRDLKPENILFQTKSDLNSLKLADFGLAAFSNEYPYLYPKCGTPGFVAPEIIQVANLVNKQDHYDVKCDVFSAGIIFHILLMGESPFQGRGHLELLRQNKICDFNERAQQYDVLSSDARSLLFKMLDLDPKVRPQASQCLDHAYFLADNYPDIGQHYFISQQRQQESVELDPHLDKMRQCSLIISSPIRPVIEKRDLVNFPMSDFVDELKDQNNDQIITPELLQYVDSGKLPGKTNDIQEKE